MHYLSHTNNVVSGDSEAIFLSTIFFYCSCTDEILIFEQHIGQEINTLLCMWTLVFFEDTVHFHAVIAI